MRKLLILLILAGLAGTTSLKADEGMWLLPLIGKFNIDKMQELGLELSAEDIYSINNSSIKDAIVIFGGGCTGELISDQGLVLTNHHCGYGAIQSLSSIENDYLTDGFWAFAREHEIPSPDLTVTFLVRMEEVTSRVLESVNQEMTEKERSHAVAAISRKIESEVSETGHFARVQPFFAGNQYYLMVYERYQDIRLVGTPPSSIGKFGGDTDNWMWPRHTGDFALFRIYTAPDGSPAEYSADNIPLRPRHYLPVSVRGVEPDDFTMVLGYPGGTSRYMTSWEVNELLGIIHPNRIRIRGIRQDIMLADMMESEKVRIQYANKYSASTNYWKYSIGQMEVLERRGIHEQKRDNEKSFTRWVNADGSRQKQYGEALDLIGQAVDARREYYNAFHFISEAIIRSCEIVQMANRATSLLGIISDPGADLSVKDDALAIFRSSAEAFYKDYNPPTDRKIVAAMLELFYNEIDRAYHPDILSQIGREYRQDFTRYAGDLFSNSLFADEKRLMGFLVNPVPGILEADPAMQLAVSTVNKITELRESMEKHNADLARGQRLFIGGLVQQYPDSLFYPDANFTMRLTYGTAAGYHPRDAVWYDYITTIEGKMEKEDPSDPEFIIPGKIKQLYNNREFGVYGGNGTLAVNFITNNDITGGNSGSPVINARGELIGLAFDGNWEAMSSDVAFEPGLQRCIAVDARYILFVIDKFAGATHLIEEMTIVN
jgi:hypothetical protein